MDIKRAMIIGDSSEYQTGSPSNARHEDHQSRENRSRSRQAERQPARGQNFMKNNNNNNNNYQQNQNNNPNNFRGKQYQNNHNNNFNSNKREENDFNLSNITNYHNNNNSTSMGSVSDELKQYLDDPVQFNNQLDEFQSQIGQGQQNFISNPEPGVDGSDERLANGETMKVRLELQGSFRHARRLYIGNIPDMITVDYLTEWLYRSLEAAGGLLEPGNPVLNTQIDPKGKFAFIEMRSIEETSSMLGLDGIILWNRSLRIRRPTEYEKFPQVEGTRPVPKLDLSLLETIGIVIIPTQVSNSDNKLFLANLPTVMDELTIMDVLKLKDYGQLKAFHLVKDSATNESKGYAFLEFEEDAATEQAIVTLNQLNLYGRQITCKRASEGPTSVTDQKVFVNNKRPEKNEPHGKTFALNELNNMMQVPFNPNGEFNNNSGSAGVAPFQKQQFL